MGDGNFEGAVRGRGQFRGRDEGEMGISEAWVGLEANFGGAEKGGAEFRFSKVWRGVDGNFEGVGGGWGDFRISIFDFRGGLTVRAGCIGLLLS